MQHSKIITLIVSFIVLSFFSTPVTAQEKDLEIPNHVLSITNENTYSNSTEDEIILEPSEFVKELIEESDIAIENPDLIQMLNETSIKTSPFAFGYRGSIYMGHWPLNYTSDKTQINWEYQQINTNKLTNTGNDVNKTISYNQLKEAHIKGALTTKIDKQDQIKKLILLKAKQNTKLPLSFHTIIGKDTKKANTYSVPVNKTGKLHAFAPAVSEKGFITYGEIYIELKGSKKRIVIKNVTKQGVGAWIPIQDYVSFSFELK
ncbi:hypothetical protein BN1058_01580 [Paraliobacillus sp. PM-2]|uniref:YfkD family protein n=1 Tax=Paraliobacillus sp. PM-2 TaxID=1462524 RepID=UPI00061BAF81|nr:YfkD family protein [Paraliobacillus sp. PM-2]CQR47272.1 hypothetical protein BN1058_01580 [Paraliobacillus sp. PM-2]